VLVPAHSSARFAPNSRVLTIDESGRALPRKGTAQADEAAWLDQARMPGRGTAWESMVRFALLDLRVLLLDGGALVAGWPDPWRYVWPRDASFAAAALTAVDHADDAVRILRFLQDVQSPDGGFQARYLPDASGPPDRRGIQRDGTGWVLWAMRRIVESVPGSKAAGILSQLGPLRQRCTKAVVAMVSNSRALPPVSPDYWEVPETVLTLGTAAPVYLGLRSARRLCTLAGETARAEALAPMEARVSEAVRRGFGPGYPRHMTGDDNDASVAFLLPPFTSAPDGDLLTAFTRAESAMHRPAGGLAPGTGWKNDGISWTAETALFGLVHAALGQDERATRCLDWLNRHRTSYGALPEKVLWDGSPAGPAPLAWSAALVVLTAGELSARTS
jgi:GH15 family glucan-1,4-alpha-glucosidase